MKKRFSEIEKEQFNARIPSDLVEKIRDIADQRGWSVGRTVTDAIARGIMVDPAEYGIEASTTAS